MFLNLDLNENENGGLYTYKTPKTEMMLFVSFVYIQVSTRRTPKTEYASFHKYGTPKTKKAVYTRIKHSNRK
jgi:hypothetical protein